MCIKSENAHPFNVGDEVRVVDGLGAPDLKVGEVYRVGSTSFGHLRLEGVAGFYRNRRFALVNRALAKDPPVQPTAPLVNRFKTGDVVRVVDASFSRQKIEVGEVYTVLEVVGPEHVRLTDGRRFSSSRFELVKAGVSTPSIRRSDAPRVAAAGDQIAFIDNRLLPGSFVNVVEGAKAPSVAFGDKDRALKEAERLARTAIGKRVLTLRVEEVSIAIQPPVTIERHAAPNPEF